MLEQSKLPPKARTHLDAASRLAQQSGELVERIYEMLQARPPAVKPVRPAPRRPARGSRSSRPERAQ